MRRILASFIAALPLAAFAAPYSNAPMLVVSQQAAPGAAPVAPAAAQAAPAAMPPAAFTPDFPEWAVTRAGENTGGHYDPPPEAPAAPAAAPAAATPNAAPQVATPAAPASPPSPISKLWPIDTLPIFMKSCMGFHVELAAPCKCVIVNLMVEMPHDEFLRLSAEGTIEQDARLNAIRHRCIGTPNRQE